MLLTFDSLAALPDDFPQGQHIEIAGFLYSFGAEAASGYAALLEELPCCIGCLPREAMRRIEIFADGALPAAGGRVRLAGRLYRLDADDCGWRYQLRQARPLDPQTVSPGPGSLLRRRSMVAAPLLCVAIGSGSAAAQPSPSGPAPATPAPATVPEAQARAAIADVATIDIHSHAGGVIGLRRVRERSAFTPLAAPMRDGGMAAICLAAVADSPAIEVTPEGRIRPFRDPAAGELYAWSQLSFQRIHDLAREQGLKIVGNAADLAAARSSRPSIIVASEGGDFLEGQAARLPEAHARWSLRHLQLTHYRVNEIGDIQTEPSVHGGLTSFGTEIVRLCNRLGVVIDVAHGTFDLVKQAAKITTKPLVLSHTSLGTRLGPRSRLITPDHARAIAGTGGVIGIWPPASIFADAAALSAGIARVVDIVGVDHVGLGSDMNGLVGASSFGSYRDLPGLSAALLARGFQVRDVRKLLGENYLRVFTRSVAG